MANYQVTGNEYLSLPTIREEDGAIEGVTFLYMQMKGLLEIRGDDGLICPYLMIDGVRAVLAPTWTRAHGWIPSMTAKFGEIAFRCTYLTPVGERAFGLRLEAINEGQTPADVRIGAEGQWDRTLHEINETAELTAGREVKHSAWNHMFVWLQRPGLPLFAFAPITEDDQPFSEFCQDAEWSQEGFGYDIHRSAALAAGECVKLDIFFGIGYEEVAAAASAKELLRQGFDTLCRNTETWLAAREKRVADPILETTAQYQFVFRVFLRFGKDA